MSFEDYKKYSIEEGYVLVDEIDEVKLTELYPKSRLKAFLDTIIYKLKDWYYGK